jgi:hypothetical protein
MKYLSLFLLCLLLGLSYSCTEDEVSKEVKESQSSASSVEGLPEELEDCDDKANKEPEPEQVLNLEGGDEGCTLEDH